MSYSRFGEQFARDCGILQLMDDLGNAAAEPGVMMLGGGNPGRIPAVEACLRDQMEALMDRDDTYERLIGLYAAPGGNREFRAAVADLLHERHGWPVDAGNIALTNGSQTAFFYLFNMFAGEFAGGGRKQILLPLTPEYIGYVDVGLSPDIFRAYRPEIEHLDGRLFKYHINFDALSVTDEIGAICVSRPTNPTGNVLTDSEIARLHALAHDHEIPLIIDNAYGTPFPGIIFVDAQPVWDERIIYCLSLSKLGLPGTRTGIVVAGRQTIAAVSGMNAILSLAPGNLGAMLALELVRSGEIVRLSREVIQPHYRHKAAQAVSWVHESLAGTDYYVHDPEGAFFLWLWLKDLPVSSQALYERLKARKVLVVPGHYFFPGLEEAWPHKDQCLRISYAQDEAIVREGIRIIGEEVRRALGGQD